MNDKKSTYCITAALWAIVAVICWHYGYTVGTVITGVLSVAYLLD